MHTGSGGRAGIVKAMREQVEDIKAAQLKIFVRRGGPQVPPSGADGSSEPLVLTVSRCDAHRMGTWQSLSCHCASAASHTRHFDR